MSDELTWDEVDENLIAFTTHDRDEILENKKRSMNNKSAMNEQANDMKLLKQHLTQLSERVSHLEEVMEIDEDWE